MQQQKACNFSYHAWILQSGGITVESMDLADTDHEAIRRVILAQLEAFRDDDGIQAFLYAAPAIRQQFKTVANFMQMVKNSYHPIYRPRGAVFGKLTELQGYPAQALFLMAESGEVVKAIYLMQRQSSLDWRIAGCFLVPIEET